jgi:50S ribosomal subunit-associated GTPase HflX
MTAVEHILGSLELMDKPILHVFNKKDLVLPELAALQTRIHHGVAVSALDESTLPPLIARLEDKVEELAAPPPAELSALPQASEGLGGD